MHALFPVDRSLTRSTDKGPPSQSLGVDPIDPQVMRRPPRKKDEPIISRRLTYRILFSATVIVVGTMYIYLYALSDDNMSRREQTMVSNAFDCALHA